MPSVQTLIARLFLVALIGMLGFFAWQTQAEPQTKFNRLTHRLMHPLDTRVRYRIGEIDPRFGLSHDEVARLTQEAVDIWTQGTGRQWFVYDRHARLTIRMIYDERQATSQLQMDAENKIDQQLLDQKTSRQALESQKTALDRSAHELTITAHTLNQSTQALSQAISQASNDSQLQYYRSQMARLDTERHALNAKIDAYHAEQARYNQAVQAYNDQTARIGAAIDEANAHFGGRSFDKGVFTGQYIDIFEFQTTDDLRLTLAHELGHALDIDHNDDPKALMYPIIGEQDAANFRLRPADLALLESR